jgi:hypothetical protein
MSANEEAFAAIGIAEINRIPPDKFLTHLEKLEKQLLTKFYAFVASRPDAVWLHWRMGRPEFGFAVLAQRARYHGLTPVEIPKDQQFDLAN